ncbi:MAG: AAA domain-containing protein [Azonexus sp.]|nr:AAA domain-containing protein [Azonexus sp.]
MRLADFPLFEPGVYVLRSEASLPKQLKPLEAVRVWRDDAGYTWLAQGDDVLELERNAGGKPFESVLGQQLAWLLVKQSAENFHLQTVLPSDWSPLDEPLEVAVDEQAFDMLAREVVDLAKMEQAHRLNWLRDEFLVCGDRPWFAVLRMQGAHKGDWSVIGRSWRLDLEQGSKGQVFLRRLSRFNAKNADWSMVIGELCFVEHTVASQVLSPAARGQLEQSVQSYGSYIDLWKKYGEEEWQRSLRQAAQLNVLAYSRADEAGDEGGVWRFKVAPAEREAFEKVWKTIESDAGLELEATAEHPEWREIQDETSAVSASRRFRGRPEFPFRKRDEILIVAVGFKRPPESGYLSLSLAGDRTVQERRLNARQAIESGRRLPQLRYIFQNIPLPTARIRREKALTPYALECFKHGKPTDSQEKAIKTALETPDIALIIGPPGTGKTQVIAALERRLSELGESASAQHQVLISSFQHDAVENALERTSVYGLPGIKVGRRRDAEGVDLIERWCDETAEKIAAELSEYETEQNHLDLLRRVHAGIAKLKHGQFSAEQRREEMLRLSECLDVLEQEHRVRLDYLLMDQWREYVSEQPAASLASRTDVPLLLRKIRALRVSPASFDDDGKERLLDLIFSVEYRGGVSEPLLKRLRDFENVHALNQDKAQILRALRDELLDSLLDYRPLTVRNRIDERGRSLLIAIEAGIEDRLKRTRLGVAGVLARYRDAFKTDPVRVRGTVREYAMVVGATCQQAASVHMASLKDLTGIGEAGISFNTVIIDEAARANPLDLFIPMSMAERRIVLVGDHRQLPHLLEPEVEDAVAVSHSLSDEQREAYKESLFQRLWRQLKDSERRDGVRRIVMLDTQFRMHPVLGDFVSREFYESEGLDPVRSGRNPDSFMADIPGHEGKVCCWIDVPCIDGEAQERKPSGNSSWMRTLEALRLAKEAKRLLDNCGDAVSIGVITFYSAQRDSIFDALQGLGVTARNADTGEWEIEEQYRKTCNHEERFRVGTVDAFQGKEFDIVLLSVVRANHQHLPIESDTDAFENAANRKYGHLRLSNRMNVAMSRQRSLLIAVGDKVMAESVGAEKGVPAMHAFLALCKGGHGHVF